MRAKVLASAYRWGDFQIFRYNYFMKIHLLAFSLIFTSMCLEDIQNPKHSIQLNQDEKKYQEVREEIKKQEEKPPQEDKHINIIVN